MAVKLKVEATIADESATAAKIKVVVKAVSTYGSWVGDKRSGTIQIAGATSGRVNFSSAYKANTTTTLATKYFTANKGESAKAFDVKVTFSSGTSSGTVTGSDSGKISALKKLTVIFKSNIAKGTDVKRTVPYGKTTTFPKTAGNITGYTLGSWNTVASGRGTKYGLGKTTPKITKDTIYYGIWTPKKYTLTFDSNQGDDVASLSVNYGGTITFPITTRSGHNFSAWKSNKTGKDYSQGQKLVWNNDYSDTFVAQWSTAYISPKITNIAAIRGIDTQVYYITDSGQDDDYSLEEYFSDYEKTDDIEIVEGKTYYEWSETKQDYQEVSSPQAENLEDYYDLLEAENFTLNVIEGHLVYTDGTNFSREQESGYYPYKKVIEDSGSTKCFLSFDWETGKKVGVTNYSTTITLEFDDNLINLETANPNFNNSFAKYIKNSSDEYIDFSISEEIIMTLTITDLINTSSSSSEGGESSNIQKYSITLGKGGNIIDISPQGHAVALFGLADENNPGFTINNRLLEDWIQPVGSVYVGQTSTNPNEIFGFGTWELYDKFYINQGFDISSSVSVRNISARTVKAIFKPGFVTVRISMTTSKAFNGDETGNDRVLLQIPHNIIGIGNDSCWTTYQRMGYANNGNIVVGFACDTDANTTVDIYPREVHHISNNNNANHDGPINSTILLEVDLFTGPSNKLNSYCDKFYWVRTA